MPEIMDCFPSEGLMPWVVDSRFGLSFNDLPSFWRVGTVQNMADCPRDRTSHYGDSGGIGRGHIRRTNRPRPSRRTTMSCAGMGFTTATTLTLSDEHSTGYGT